MNERAQDAPAGTIRVAHSPDSDDAFMFYALANDRLDTGNLRLEHVVIPFDEIMEYVARGEADVGLLIHEGQLTHESDGFSLIEDLGEWWYSETGLPLPLGGNVVRRDLGEETIREVARLIKASIQYALDHREEALAYALDYARDLPREQADRFVSMYVNEWTVDYGETGREAVRTLLSRGHEAGVIPHKVEGGVVGEGIL